MPKSLPPKPSLEILKKQAKDILAAHGTGDPSCCKTLRLLHHFANKLDPEILRSQLKLHDAQFALALDYGFSSWADLVHFLRPSGQFDFASPEFVRNAYPWYERLHAAGGIERAEEGHWWVVSSADLVETLLSDPRLKNAGAFEGDLAAVDGADHRRRRLLVSKWFAHSAVDRMEPMIRRIVETLVEEVAESGSFDAISELAQPIARTVICDLVGIPDDVRNRATNKEAQHPLDYKRTVEQLAIDLLRSPEPGTLIADLAKAVKDEAMSIEEAASNVYAVIVGGDKPTEALLVNALAELFRRPSIVDSLREDRDGVLRFVNEVLRYESPAWNAGRLVRDPIEVRGKKLEADDTLVLLISAANRDGQRFPKPNQFRRSRHGRHLAFGRGPHACPGTWLALREATILIDVLLDWEVAIEGEPGPFFVSGGRRPESLRMTVSRS